MAFIQHSFQDPVLYNVSVHDNSVWISYFRGRWALTVLRERVMRGHVHLTGVLSGRNGTISNRLVQLKHWYAEWLTDPAVSLSIEILQCHFFLNIFDWLFWFILKKLSGLQWFFVCYVLCAKCTAQSVRWLDYISLSNSGLFPGRE